MARRMRMALCAPVLMLPALAGPARAQVTAPAAEYVRPPVPQPGMAPGLKATELNPQTRHFQLVFSKGDAVIAGLTEFAEAHHITVAHFTALGALGAAQIGWFDPDRKSYKLLRLNEEMEVTSLTGNITRDRNGKPVVHVHCVLASLADGSVHAGHLLEGTVSVTLQLYLEDSQPLATAP